MIAPECLDGATVLDLGSGSGLDVFVLSKLVGETGNIVGVDMTQEQVIKYDTCHYKNEYCSETDFKICTTHS